MNNLKSCEQDEQVQEIHALQEKSRGMIRYFSAEMTKLIHGVLGHARPLHCNASHSNWDDWGLMSSIKTSRRLQVDRAPSIKLGDGAQADEADSHSISVQPSCLCGKLFSGWKMWKSVIHNSIYSIRLSCTVMQCTLTSMSTHMAISMHAYITEHSKSKSELKGQVTCPH